ncbi:MAG: glycosyltransferase family 4 protein [Chloroflexi bacterium]|nr:glycosyltransferase family 4 protein [Chloroflexota bacterium]
MRILVCSLYAPYPPYDGGSTRTIELLKPLGAKHKVTLLGTFDPVRQAQSAVEAHLSSYVQRVRLLPDPAAPDQWGRWQKLRELFAYPPSRLTRFLSDSYARVAQELLGQTFDLVICNTILPGQLFARLSTDSPKLLDVLDVMGLLREREFRLAEKVGLDQLFKYVDWKKTAAYERRVWRRFDGLIAMSQQDADSIGKSYPAAVVSMIPMGVHLPPDRDADCDQKVFDVLFVGKLDYAPNVDALEYFDRDVLPRLAGTIPGLKIAIVGKNPSGYLVEWVRQRGNYALYPDVPDVAPFYRQSKVVIVPMRTGSGIKVKLLEALSYGLPTVTTTIGATGLSLQDGRHVLIGDDPQTFARHIEALLGDLGLSRSLGTQGRGFVAQRYDWSQIQRRYLEFVERVAGCSA